LLLSKHHTKETLFVQLSFFHQFLIIKLVLQPSTEALKEVAFDTIQTIIGTNFYQFPIKNDLNVTLGYATFNDEGDYNEALDSGEQLIKYYGLVILQYRTSYGMVI
jgi:hypothetical protein